MATLHSSHLQVNSATSTSNTDSIVLIDMAVEDYSGLVNGVLDNTQVFLLDSTDNGVEQITEILGSCTGENLTNIHLVCHGAPGCLQLGNTHLRLDTLEEYSQQLQRWQKIFLASAKSDNRWNLLIYGCKVAFGDAGAEFVEKLHQLTGANIAASGKLIGNAALDGNWELEVRTAEMEVNLAFAETTREAYAGVLATFTVNNTGDTDDGNANNGITTLREAIKLANATPGDDTITFGGMFSNTTPDVITLTSGQLTITDDVTILGTGASKLTVSGKNASTIFEISGLATDAIIDGLAIASGSIKVNKNSILSLANTSVSGNTAESGISNNGILGLTNTSVFSNTQGGIYNGGTLSLTNSSVYGNTGGSKIYNGNTAGGGIFNDSFSVGKIGILSLTNSSVSGNTADSGGGIYNQGGTLRLTNSTVSGNSAKFGGGIFNGDDNSYFSGSATLTNSTISGNTALEDGGAIYNGNAYGGNNELTIISTTINHNTADSDGNGTGNGGGIFNDVEYISSSNVKVSNTIIAGNFDNSTSGDRNPDVRGELIDSGNNLIGNNTGSTAFTTSTLVGTSTNPINPKLGLLQNNGGATLTHALLAGSPAINAGKNSLVTTGIPTDQRGAGFNRIFNGVIDIGAYEVQPPTTKPPVNTDTVVTNTNDSGAGSLRQAILNANATLGADTITFAGLFTDATPDIITLTSGKLTITNDITILGTGASNVTISGNNVSGVLEISGSGTDASIDGLKIANANDLLGSILVNSNTSLNLTRSTVSDNNGVVGGIFNRGTLSLTGSTVSGNSGSLLGGGIFNKGNLSLTGSTVSNNNVDLDFIPAYGGGIFNIGKLSITGSTVSNNSAFASGLNRGSIDPYPSFGGGIYNLGSLDITRSTVSNNSASDGGGISNSGTFSLTGSTVSANSAYYDGGGIYNNGTLSLANDTITDNISKGFVADIGDGGGVFNNSDGTVIVGNTVIAGNFDMAPNINSEPFIFTPDVSGNFTDAGNNLIGDRTGSTGFTTSTLVGTSANPIDPKLTLLQNNGGATLTHALLADSPAINAGKNALTPAGSTTDQRGAGFDRISKGTVDIGALEFNGLNGTNGADNIVGKNYGDIISGQGGNDTITGNQGNDFLTGGGGKDKFVYNLGDGVDTITNFGGLGKGSNPSAAVIAELDTLKFQGTGLTAKNLLLTQNGKNLEVTFDGVADDKVILQNFPLENLDNLSTLGNILFDGQSSIRDSLDVFDANSTQSTICNKNTVTFLNDLNNNINGFDNSADVINGQEGDDYINGLSGNDLLRGGTGNDTLVGSAGDDILIGGKGSNNLSGGAGNDILLVGDYDADYSSDDQEQNDILYGGSGNDQFIYQSYSTNNIIIDFNQSEDKLVLTNVFKNRGYTGNNPIADGYLQFVQSGTATKVNYSPYTNGGYFDETLATLNNFTATNLVIGTNVIV